MLNALVMVTLNYTDINMSYIYYIIIFQKGSKKYVSKTCKQPWSF